MICTIKLILTKHQIEDINKLTDYLISLLDNPCRIRSISGEEVFKGYFQGMKVSISTNCLKVEGSITKYWKGSNQLNLRISEFIVAIDDLSEKLQAPLRRAKVVRLDIGVNIPLIHPEYQYYDVLGHLDKFNRHKQLNGLNYQDDSARGKWYVSIYEKLKNVKFPQIVTELFKDQYVLRLEYRFLKAYELSKYLKVDFVTPDEVYRGYPSLMRKWEEIFLAIEKKHDLIDFKPEVFTKRNTFDKQVRLMGVKLIGGLEAIISLVKKAKKANLFSYPNQSSNIINRYKSLLKTPDLTMQNDLATEFERKVRMIAQLTSLEQIEDKILAGEVLTR